MKAENRAAGSCHCGAIKILATLPVKGCVHCHCFACRHIHGAAFVTWFSVPRESLQLHGREHLKWYAADEDSRRGFCGNCGTHVLFVSGKYPEDVHIPRACVINDVDVSPRAHLFFDQHVTWYPFVDPLPRFGGPLGMDPLQAGE